MAETNGIVWKKNNVCYTLMVILKKENSQWRIPQLYNLKIKENNLKKLYPTSHFLLSGNRLKTTQFWSFKTATWKKKNYMYHWKRNRIVLRYSDLGFSVMLLYK